MVRSGRLRVACAAALVLLLALTACAAQEQPSEDERVRGTILRYNTLLAEGYRAQKMDPLGSVASDLQTQDEYVHMSSLAEGGIRMLPTLRDVEFVKLSIETTHAVVETRETWDFAQESTSTRELVARQRELIYELAWELSTRDDGSWYVSDVRAISTTSTVEPEIFAPGAMQPRHP